MITMRILDYLLVLDAVAHMWLAIATMAFWKKSIAREIFDFDDSIAAATAPMAKLLGAMYLVFALSFMYCYIGEAVPVGLRVVLLFSQLVAGAIGGYFVSKKLLLIQAAPGFLGLIMLWSLSDLLF